jgi:hypothetical protein
MGGLPFAICHLIFDICHLIFAICHLISAIWQLCYNFIYPRFGGNPVFRLTLHASRFTFHAALVDAIIRGWYNPFRL